MYRTPKDVAAFDKYYFKTHVPIAKKIGGAFVTFDAGARTAWHTHPLGQTLIVTSCPSRKSYPQVAMMQSGQDLCGDDGPRSLDGSSSRRVLAQPQVCARLIVVERIKSQDPS
jgi:hypothetical protein